MKIKIKKSMIAQAVKQAWMPRPTTKRREPHQVDVSKKLQPVRKQSLERPKSRSVQSGPVIKIIGWLKRNFPSLPQDDKDALMRALKAPFSRGTMVQDASQASTTSPIPVEAVKPVEEPRLGPLSDIVGWLKNNYDSMPSRRKFTLSQTLSPLMTGGQPETRREQGQGQTVLQDFRSAMDQSTSLNQMTSIKSNELTKMISDQMQGLWVKFVEHEKRKGRRPTVDRFNLVIKRAVDQGGIAEERYVAMVQALQKALQHGQIRQTEGEPWWRSRNKGTTDPTQKFTQKGTMGHKIKSKVVGEPSDREKRVAKDARRQSW